MGGGWFSSLSLFFAIACVASSLVADDFGLELYGGPFEEAQPGEIEVQVLEAEYRSVFLGAGFGSEERFSIRVRITNTSERELAIWQGPASGVPRELKLANIAWYDGQDRLISQSPLSSWRSERRRVVTPPAGFLECGLYHAQAIDSLQTRAEKQFGEWVEPLSVRVILHRRAAIVPVPGHALVETKVAREPQVLAASPAIAIERKAAAKDKP